MIYLNKSIVCALLIGLPLMGNASNYTDTHPSWDIYPYLGVEVGSTKLDNFNDDTTMVGVVGGLQFNDYLGLELHWSKSTDKINSSELANLQRKKISLNTYGIGLTFQADLTQRLYAKSFVGASRLDSNAKIFRDDVGVAKLGLGYQFTPDVAAELTYDFRFGDSNSRGIAAQLKYYF